MSHIKTYRAGQSYERSTKNKSDSMIREFAINHNNVKPESIIFNTTNEHHKPHKQPTHDIEPVQEEINLSTVQYEESEASMVQEETPRKLPQHLKKNILKHGTKSRAVERDELLASTSMAEFHSILSMALLTMVKTNTTELISNILDSSGKVILDANTLCQLIGILTSTEKDRIVISYSDYENDSETGCLCSTIAKISPIKNITNITVECEEFVKTHNIEYNMMETDYNISLTKCIINSGFVITTE